MSSFHALVINVEDRHDRRETMKARLYEKGISAEFLRAVEPKNITNSKSGFLTEVAESVWRSHSDCLKKAASFSKPTLIFEDDAIVNFESHYIEYLAHQMESHDLDFIQIGFLKVNLADSVSIGLRNAYSLFTRNAFASRFFKKFGFKEVERAKSQSWRRSLSKDFIVNDIRYGAHCYLVSQKFASRILPLNTPTFLPADDFYVALGHSKSFKMIRLKASRSPQDGSPSSFTSRFLLS